MPVSIVWYVALSLGILFAVVWPIVSLSLSRRTTHRARISWSVTVALGEVSSLVLAIAAVYELWPVVGRDALFWWIAITGDVLLAVLAVAATIIKLRSLLGVQRNHYQ